MNTNRVIPNKRNTKSPAGRSIFFVFSLFITVAVEQNDGQGLVKSMEICLNKDDFSNCIFMRVDSKLYNLNKTLIQRRHLVH